MPAFLAPLLGFAPQILGWLASTMGGSAVAAATSAAPGAMSIIGQVISTAIKLKEVTAPLLNAMGIVKLATDAGRDLSPEELQKANDYMNQAVDAFEARAQQIKAEGGAPPAPATGSPQG